MLARLIFITGSKAGTAVDLTEGTTTLGRSGDRTVTFAANEVLVSGQHASIEYRDGRYVLRDAESRNGTFVNAEGITERVLSDGDLIQLGAGGPAAQFVLATEVQTTQTLDPEEMRKAFALIELTKRQVAAGRLTVGADPRVATTRELATMTYRRSVRRGREILALALVVLLAIVAVVVWQQRSKDRLERTLAELSLALASERSSRSALEQSLAAVGARYDSLSQAVDGSERSAAREGRVDLTAVRDYAQGVALIVFSYGYGHGDELLRYAVDSRGAVVTRPGPRGEPIPGISLGGRGPAVRHHGTATGFLIDTTGLMLTNRHVARPWEEDPELASMQAAGFDVSGRILDLRAFFPPGERPAPLVVETVSDRADVALVRVLGGRVEAPVLPLAPATTSARPGDPLVFIGYPTGPFNLLFRVDEAERGKILELVGDDERRLVEELASRRLIQPLITNGTVSDTTSREVIHTAATTVGGSGGPLIDSHLGVVAVHYAFVRSPTPGDPFRTQRGVPIRFAWDILPSAVQTRLVAPAP
jgi:S1-C subfamily serine protease